MPDTLSVTTIGQFEPARFDSEELEPFAQIIMGRASLAYMALAAAKVDNDHPAMRTALLSVWRAAQGLATIASSLRYGRPATDRSGLHFSLAAQNELIRLASFVRETIGVDPFEEWP